jgi:SAM-dependent methyltransferase
VILDDWFQTAQGQSVAEEFVSQLQAHQSKFVGNNLLQLGNCGKNPWLSLFKFKNLWITSTNNHCRSNSMLAESDQLPFDRNSIDYIIAPLTLEFSLDNDRLLNEIDRVLKPMGYVIFLDINPFSLWGLKFALQSYFESKYLHLTSFFKLQNAMEARGYQQCFLKHFYFIPPIQNKQWLKRLQFLNHMSEIITPAPAGFYCTVMQKYQENLLTSWENSALYFA